MTFPNVLSSNDIAAFEENGYLHVPRAFERQSALAMHDYIWSQLKQLKGIDRYDRSTWSRRWAGINHTRKNPIYQSIASERLCGAISQLLGQGKWDIPSGWGNFLITFPADTGEAWSLTEQKWHWDGNPKQELDGLNGLDIFTFFSFVRPSGGGTVIAKGSHRLLLRFVESVGEQKFKSEDFFCSHPWLAELAGYGEDKGKRVERFMRHSTKVEGTSLQVVELTGEPGDAVICHPSIVHARRSPNHSDAPRFMRKKSIRRRHH